MFGRANWSRSFLNDSAIVRTSLLDAAAANKVIPLITQRMSAPAAVEHAVLVTLFNSGLIRRICVSHHVSEEWVSRTSLNDVISKLRDIFPGPDVTFSGRFSKPGHALIYVSYSSATTAPLAA